MKVFNYVLLGLMTAAFVIVMFPLGGIAGLLFASPFCLWPVAGQVVLTRIVRPFGAQVILTATSLLYAGWFAYLYMYATVWYRDPQSPIVFLFTGIYAVPVLLPLWGLAFGLNRKPRSIA